MIVVSDRVDSVTLPSPGSPRATWDAEMDRALWML